jgi:hypothetical protein
MRRREAMMFAPDSKETYALFLIALAIFLIVTRYL